jgi:glutathione synthase/RimK-type ligase-like ATP-grasp enzyme
MSSRQNSLVLVVGSAEDPHVQRVLEHVCACGSASFILDPLHGEAASIICRLSDGNVELLGRDSKGKRVALSDVTAVWWRLKPSYQSQDSGNAQASDFRKREWMHVLESLEVLIGDAKWVNPRAVDRRLRYKPGQLLLARRSGFDTPDTIISNDPAAISDFLDHHEGAGIYKPLTWYFEPPDKILFTNSITTKFIAQNGASVGRAPGIFQPRIPKSFELRITIVGEKVFPIRVESQAHNGAQLDWRRKQLDLTYRSYSLKPSFQERLLNFHRSLGLVYGAYDFIVTPDDRLIFLEVNPAGQWLWIEDLTSCPISEAVADALFCDQVLAVRENAPA